MGVYGDQLAFFQEQFRRFDYFSMEAKPVAGYRKRVELGKIRGVFQYVKRGDLGREDETLAEETIPTVWTRTKLRVGNFLYIEEDNYRIVKPYTWKFEGNFYCYELELVVANTDEQKPMEGVNLGQGDYY